MTEKSMTENFSALSRSKNASRCKKGFPKHFEIQIPNKIKFVQIMMCKHKENFGSGDDYESKRFSKFFKIPFCSHNCGKKISFMGFAK